MMASCAFCGGVVYRTDPSEEVEGGLYHSSCLAKVTEANKRRSEVTLTTAHHLDGYRVKETLDVITAECVFGMNIFRDFFAQVRDVFGGRSKAAQKVLLEARNLCLNQLRDEAHSLGANAVIAVDLDYSEFSGQGKSMLFLVASGTAVVVEPMKVPTTVPLTDAESKT